MRTLLIILGSIALLVGGFFVYFSLQTTSGGQDEAAGRAAQRPLAPPPPTTGPTSGVVAGAGQDVWVKSYDEKTGQVAFEFRASRYDPKPDQSVEVENPQARIYLGREDRQVVRIEGKTGQVVMATDAAQRGQLRSRDASAPRRGVLRDVEITLFDASDETRPLMRCRVNNIAFDNDTYRIATESYDDDGGTRVPADQVRVEVRGDEFDFDGRGLVIRWNEADRRLQLLEIAHGESLTIKSPRLLQTFQRGEAAGSARGAAGAARPARLESAEPEVVPAKHQPAGDSQEAQPPGNSDAPVYRANFVEDVRVTQDQAQIAAADQMHVDFSSAGDEPVSTKGDEATGNRPTTKRAAPTDTPELPTAQPLVVQWKGKLRVTALETGAPRPAPGSINIAMSAEPEPVQLDYRGMKLSCAALDYRSGDDSLTVTSSPAQPLITLTTSDGTTVHTPSIAYAGLDSTATMRGPSRAEIKLDAPAGADPSAQTMQAQWEQSCVFTLLRTSDNRITIERAALEGEVNIIHPQIAMRSDTLELGLAHAPAPRAGESDRLTVDELKADGAVHCKFEDSDGAKHDIRCDHLTATADPQSNGQRVAIVADGRVRAVGDDHDLTAGRVTIAAAQAEEQKRADAPAPAPEPLPRQGVLGGENFKVESILAQQDVALKLRDGGSATAQQMQLKIDPRGTSAELLGQPAAVLSDGRNTLRGPHIRYEQATQQVRVHGPGTLEAMLEADDPGAARAAGAAGASGASGSDPRPVRIAWDSGLNFNGHENSADVNGNVNVTTREPDGTQMHLSADKVLVAFADEPAASKAAAREPADGGDDRGAQFEYFDVMRGKTWQRVTLDGSARVESLLMGDDDSQFRRMTLLGPRVEYNLLTGQALVPAKGQILMQDTFDNAASANAEQQKKKLLDGFRGATAIQWDERLEFIPESKQAVLTGGVTVVHQDPGRENANLRLESGRAILQFAQGPDAPDAQDAPATQPEGGERLFDMSSLHLAGLRADGGVRVLLPQIVIDAIDASYDASSELLTARGTERQPVQLLDPQGISQGSFEEIVWDARAEQIQRMRNVQAQVRR